jgi:hypothetical protein
MNKFVFTAALLGASALSALAQTAPAATNDGKTPAVATPGSNNATAPVEGANSFTEGQAKSKIEEAGYTNVTSLKKDDNGVWRGKASKGGASSNVSLDFQGNVNAAK